MPWVFLAAAIAAEICATLGLRAISGSPAVLTVSLVVVGYVVSFVFLALALRQLKVGVVYAIWSGVGTAAVAAAGTRLFGDRLDARAIIGIVIIVLGVVVLVSSKATSHA